MAKGFPQISRNQVGCLAGFAGYWTWVFCAVLTNSFVPAEQFGTEVDVWFVSTIGHLVALAALGVLAEKCGPYSQKPLMYAAASSACVAGFFLIVVAGGYEEGAVALTVFGAVTTGVGTALVVILWAELFVACCRGYALVGFLFVGLTVSALASLALSLLPAPLTLVVLVLLPLASVALLLVNGKEVHLPPVGQPRSIRSLVSWRFVAYCLVFPIPLGLFQAWFHGHDATLASWAPLLALSVPILVLVAVADRAGYRMRRVSIAEKLVMPVSVAGLFFLVAFDSGAMLAGGVLVFTSQQIMTAVLYARFGLVALREEAPAAKVFAAGIAATDCGFILGMVAGNLVQSSFSNHSLYLILGIVYLIVMAAFLNVGSLSRKEEAVRSADSTALEFNLQDVAQAHGLTARESEILEYLSRGKSVPAIASEVFLSVNTVRTHIAHIYQKFDVHSRDELVSAVDEALSGNANSRS